ncbi:hypothetical protein B0J17DRAFT_666911 [Rhizoctonia solani]|nr:hypothetical protein B0J17DRAFT_666911 [Rhizoctonia solani]
MVSAALLTIFLSAVGVFASPTPVEGVTSKRQYPPGTDPIFDQCLPDGAGCIIGAGRLCCTRGACVPQTAMGTYGYCNVRPPPPDIPAPTASETTDSVGRHFIPLRSYLTFHQTPESVSPTFAASLE